MPMPDPDPVRVPLYGPASAPDYRPAGGWLLGAIVLPAGAKAALDPGCRGLPVLALAADFGVIRLGAWEALDWARRGQNGLAWEPA